MKKIIPFIFMLSTVVQSQELSIVAVEKPSALNEGIERTLTADQIAELLPWAKDTKLFLTDLLENVQGLTMSEKVERLQEGIKNSVIDSAPKNSELLMRYALNRGLVLSSLIDREMDADAVGTIDAKSRVLVLSINMALKYYENDMERLSKKTASPFAQFGIEYNSFLNELNKSIFDASAQYNIQRLSLEWLQWDLYRDLNNTKYAAQITKTNNALKTFPTKKLTDASSISYIRQMKKVSQQLNLGVQTKVERQNVEVPAPVLKGKFRYSSYYNACYRVSNTGELMTNQKVADINCSSGRFEYSTYYNACYMRSTDNELMTSTKMPDDKCHNQTYKYSTYYNKCFKVSNSNELMTTSPVDDQYCASGKAIYSSYYAACFKVSNSGEMMTTSRVDSSECAN